jgi:hypothetical protein
MKHMGRFPPLYLKKIITESSYLELRLRLGLITNS